MQSKLDQFKILMAMDISYMPPEYGRDIFHYTSPSGFQSILFGNSEHLTLWASRYDCLNDVSEGKVVLDAYAETCAEMLASGEIDKYLYDLFVRVKPAHTTLLPLHAEDTIKFSRPECHRYVCSFSKNADSLAMWNYYSKGNKYEGFNIGVFPSVLSESLEEMFRDKEAVFHVYPVIYDKAEQKRLIRATLLQLRDHYAKDQETSIRYIIANRLLDWQPIFKSDYFQHEEEVRIIVDLPKQNPPVPIKQRITAGFVIPYIELQIEKTALSFVNFGPLQSLDEQKKQQIRVMEDWLEQSNYSAIVECSKIPVRY